MESRSRRAWNDTKSSMILGRSLVGTLASAVAVAAWQNWRTDYQSALDQFTLVGVAGLAGAVATPLVVYVWNWLKAPVRIRDERIHDLELANESQVTDEDRQRESLMFGRLKEQARPILTTLRQMPSVWPNPSVDTLREDRIDPFVREVRAASDTKNLWQEHFQEWLSVDIRQHRPEQLLEYVESGLNLIGEAQAAISQEGPGRLNKSRLDRDRLG